MPEYISREAAKERFKRIALVGTDYIMQRLDEVPAADVVEVVRCKDCKHYDTLGCADGFGCCGIKATSEKDEHYCNFGCRKGRNHA